MKKALAIMICLLLLSAPRIIAQDFCKDDFNYTGSVAAEDVETFLEHFERNKFSNLCPPDGPAPVPEKGQATCYDETGASRPCAGTGEDGEYQKAVNWLNPRFTDNGDATIT